MITTVITSEPISHFSEHGWRCNDVWRAGELFLTLQSQGDFPTTAEALYAQQRVGLLWATNGQRSLFCAPWCVCVCMGVCERERDAKMLETKCPGMKEALIFALWNLCLHQCWPWWTTHYINHTQQHHHQLHSDYYPLKHSVWSGHQQCESWTQDTEYHSNNYENNYRIWWFFFIFMLKLH